MLLRLVLGLSLVTRRQFDSYRSCFWDLLDWTRAVFSLKLIISHHCGEPSCELNSMPMSSVCLMGIVTILSPVVSTKHYFLCFWVVISVVLSRYFIDMVYWRSERDTTNLQSSPLCSLLFDTLFCEISLPWFAPDSQLQLSGSVSTWVSSACTHSPEIFPKAVS